MKVKINDSAQKRRDTYTKKTPPGNQMEKIYLSEPVSQLLHENRESDTKSHISEAVK